MNYGNRNHLNIILLQTITTISFLTSSCKAIETLWYKPHWQCGGSGSGSTPQQAADFINSNLVESSSTDFVGVCEWEVSESVSTIGNTDVYGSIGSACGYAQTSYTAPVVLFYRRDKWNLEASYPSSPTCQDKIPVPNATGSWTGPQIGDVCVDKVAPGDDDCCSCTFSEEEYSQGNEMGQALGQRAWAGGLFSMKEGTYDEEIGSPPKVCMVVGEMPHPLSNTSLYDLNGVATSDPRPFSIMRYICTSLLNPEICVPNSDGTSKILFGSSSFVEGVSELCGDAPIVVMFDSNAGAGDFPTWVMFNTEPLLGLAGAVDNDGLEPYTCCNDTHLVDIDPSQFRIDSIAGGNKGLNRYASDRIAASVETFKIDKLEGGSIALGGPVDAVGLGYQCHAAQEHLPLRAYITDNRLPAVVIQEGVGTSSSSGTSLGTSIKSMKTMVVGIGGLIGTVYLI